MKKLVIALVIMFNLNVYAEDSVLKCIGPCTSQVTEFIVTAARENKNFLPLADFLFLSRNNISYLEVRYQNGIITMADGADRDYMYQVWYDSSRRYFLYHGADTLYSGVQNTSLIKNCKTCVEP